MIDGLPGTLRAPAKLNLCLYVGPRRDDGLHEIRSLFEPLELADELRISEADADEVICEGIEGPDLTATALAALREHGWDGPRLRIEVTKRIPVAAGLGGGSADAAAVLRLAMGEVEGLRSIAAGIGADVPSQLQPRPCLVAGAGEVIEPAPPPGEHAVVLIPQAEGLATAAVYAEADRLGSPRGDAELEAIRRRLRDAVDEGGSPLDYREHLVNDLQAAAISLRPEIEDALRALEEAGAAHAMVTGSGPTAFGLYPTADQAAAAAGRAARPLSGRDRDRPADDVSGRIDRKWVIRGLVVAAIVAFFVFRDQLPSINLDKIIEDLSQSLGSWTYLLVGTLAFLETGAFVGLVAPGEFTVLLGGAVASQGDISLPLIIAVTWISAFAGDSVSFMLGAHLGRGFLVQHGRRVGITPERLKQVETYFARYGGRTILIGRFIGLVRALAPFIAGSSQLAVQGLRPVQHPRHGSVVDRSDPARLFLRAEPRQGHEHRRHGPPGLRDRRRDRRGSRRGLPVPAQAGEPAHGGCRDGEAARPPPDPAAGAPPAAGVRVPVAEADAGWAGPRVHDTPGGALGRAVRPDRLLDGDRRAIRGRRRGTAPP